MARTVDRFLLRAVLLMFRETGANFDCRDVMCQDTLSPRDWLEVSLHRKPEEIPVC